MNKSWVMVAGILLAAGIVLGDLLAQEKPDSKRPVMPSKALKTKRVDVNFEATPLKDLVNFLRTLADVNIVLDSNMDRDVQERLISLSLSDVTLGTALDVIVGKKLAYAVKEDVIVITVPPMRSGQAKQKPPSKEALNLLATIKSKRIDVKFEATPLTDALKSLRTLTKTNIVLDPDIEDREAGERPITLSLTNVKLASLLDLLAGNELTYVVKGNVIVITRKACNYTDETMRKPGKQRR